MIPPPITTTRARDGSSTAGSDMLRMLEARARFDQWTQPPTENSLVLPFGVVVSTVTVWPNVALGDVNVATPDDDAVAVARYVLPWPPRPAPRDDRNNSTAQPAHVFTVIVERSACVIVGVRTPSFASGSPTVVFALPNGVRSIAARSSS